MARADHAALVVLVVAAWTATARAYIRRPDYVRPNTPPEMWMGVRELVESRGYPLEEHQVRTPDGYILTLHRIRRRGLDGKLGGRGTPVLAGHGLGSSSEQWVIRGRDNLAFFLVDNGYDMWLGNYRGSLFGRKHAWLSADSREFWDFSWHENAVYDQAAMIDYILAVTGKPALHMLGHSMSSTVQVVLLAERPSYSKKVLANVLMAPPTFFSRPSGFFVFLDAVFRSSALVKSIAKTAWSSLLVNDGGRNEPYFGLCYLLGGASSNLTMPPACFVVFETACGKMREPVNMELVFTFLAHFPSGNSNRQMLHYAQSILEGGDFRRFDFGPKKNQRLYGAAKPPSYNLSRITAPTYIYYGHTDNFVNYKDAETLASKIPSLERLYKMPYLEYNHVDFLMSEHVREDLNKLLLQSFNKYV